MTAPTDTRAADLRSAAEALKARVDDWVQAIQAVGGSASDAAEALEDPRLDAAEEEFEAAVAGLHLAAGPVLGLPEPDDDEESDLEVEELALHVLVGVPEGAPEPARDAATLVHEAGERLVGQLTSAGYQVPAWQFGCEVELLLDDEDEDGDTDLVDADLDSDPDSDPDSDEDDGEDRA